MIRVSKLLLEAPKAFAGGKTGMEPSPKTDPTAIPGGKASTPGSSSTPKQKAPSYGRRDPASGGKVYRTGNGQSPSDPTPVATTRTWETTIWSEEPDETLDRILRA